MSHDVPRPVLDRLRDTLIGIRGRNIAAAFAQHDRITRIEESQADVDVLLNSVERVTDWLEFTEPAVRPGQWDEGYRAAMETVRAALDQAQKDTARP